MAKTRHVAVTLHCKRQSFSGRIANMEVIIKPNNTFHFDLNELWNYRELLYIFTWRDIKVRYRQTFLGVAWVLFQPVATTAIFSIFFGKLAKISSGNLPYPLFVLIGLIIWTFFSSALSTASMSLVSYENMIKKVYFPRIIIPLSEIITACIDFFATIFFLVVMIIYYRFFPNPAIILVGPLLLIILLATICGLSFFAAAFNIKYRDVRFILPFFIQIGLFVSPVIYPIAVIFDYRKWLLYINPLTGVIETFRALIANDPLNWPLIGVSAIGSSIILFFGLLYFVKTERYFADIA